MAWPMPTVGQWPTGMTVAPDGNMGNITAEQWAAMQQQQWQWAQWQQQYASWQSQYGSKYAEQMQAMQSMGVMPPLPPSNAAPPPAPPPPDKPPPPPHENNQPLYGQTQQQPTPVMAPGANNAPSNNIDISTGNNQNRSYATDSSVNSEALKTLAEEEKAFDIQFEKWEEEIENWKKANMNHPDKKAYEEYEQRFEACRARLLERRQQMKQKRAKLLGNTQQNSNAPRHNISITVPPPVNNTTSSNYNMKKENFNDSFPPQNSNKNMSQIPPIANAPQTDYRREYSKNFDPQDRYESYSNTSNMIPNNNLVSTEPFLQPSAPSKGIPGLDLVVEGDRFGNKVPEIVDITGESTAELPSNERPAKQEPDYSKISKGINNILGDEKIMNILSMVRGQIQPSNNAQNAYGSEVGNNSNNYWDRNKNKNDNYGMSSNTPYVNQQNDYSAQQDNSQSSNFATVPPRTFNNRPNNTPQDQYYDRNQQYNNSQAMPSRPMPPPSMQPPSMQPGSVQSQSMQSGQMSQGPIQSGTMPLGSNMPRQMQQNVSHNMPMRSLLDPLPQNDFNSRGMDRRPLQEVPPNGGVAQNMPVRPHPPARPSWANEPLFAPSIIVEYEHKPLRLKARDFIEPVHTFDYNHQSKDSDSKKVDFEKEVDELFSRHPRAFEKEDRYPERHRDLYYRDLERNSNRDHLRDFRDDQHFKGAIREEYDDRRRYDDDIRDKRYDDRRRDDRDKYTRREDMGHRERDRERDDMFRDRDRDRELERIRDRERERDLERIRERERDLDRIRERDRDMYRDRDRHRDNRRSRSRERESRKRGHSRDSERSNVSASKRSKEGTTSSRPNDKPKHTVMIDDILEPPGRHMRPEKIVIILRGPPGSGKSYLAKLIREREAEQGGTVRVMSIDDYFMQEGEIEEKDPTTGKIVKKPSLKYEYDEKQEETYLNSLKRAFKRSLTDGYFTFLIYDAVNDQLRSYADIWNFARQNGFQVYICTMELDPSTCFKRNIHGRRLEDIEVISARFFPTPDHHIQLDPTTLLQSASITEVQMEDVEDYVQMEDAQETEVDKSFTSKWEKMEDAAQLARLDGIAKPLRPSQLSMEDYLQLDDWKPNISKPGKKTVRWADIEERREQEKMRAIGFVVGQTDWNRMTDPTMGSSALTQTKYIERVRRN